MLVDMASLFLDLKITGIFLERAHSAICMCRETPQG